MNRLDKVKEVVKKYIKLADCGLYFTRNLLGDPMATIYEDDGITIDLCYHYSYFEIFGLNEAEQEKILEYYKKLVYGKEEEDENN